MLELKTLYRNLRIKYKIVALITAVIATFGILIVAVQQYAFDVYDREIYEQSSVALNSAAVSIENELRKVQQQSYRMATDEMIQAKLTAIKDAGNDYDRFVAADQIRERLVLLGGLDKYVRSVQVIDHFGGEYFVGRAAVTYSNEQIERLDRETAMTEGGNTWLLPNDEDATLAAARLIRSYEELSLEKLGILAIRIDMGRLTAEMASGALPAGGHFFVFDEAGQAVYPIASELPSESIRGYAQVDQGGYDVVKLDGSRYFLTRVPSAYTDWSYITLISYDDIFDRLADVKRLTLSLYSLLFLLAVFAAFRFARGITDPIEKLNAKMKRVQLGNFTYEAEEDSRHMPMDESGQLHRNFRIMLQRIDELIRENYIKQLAMKESEFKALQAQINPHFLYNTLETINWSSKMAGQHGISSMVESLGFLLRSSISLKEPMLPMRQELEIVLHYVNIQRIRFEERLDFRLHVPEPLGSSIIPKLSIQPLVENAVNYALERMTDTCLIEVDASESNGQLLITVRDNGPGLDEAILDRLRTGKVKPKGSGVGLLNIDERIKLLFGAAYGLEIESRRGEGTLVLLRLPNERGGTGDV